VTSSKCESARSPRATVRADPLRYCAPARQGELAGHRLDIAPRPGEARRRGRGDLLAIRYRRDSKSRATRASVDRRDGRGRMRASPQAPGAGGKVAGPVREPPVVVRRASRTRSHEDRGGAQRAQPRTTHELVAQSGRSRHANGPPRSVRCRSLSGTVALDDDRDHRRALWRTADGEQHIARSPPAETEDRRPERAPRVPASRRPFIPPIEQRNTTMSTAPPAGRAARPRATRPSLSQDLGTSRSSPSPLETRLARAAREC